MKYCIEEKNMTQAINSQIFYCSEKTIKYLYTMDGPMMFAFSAMSRIFQIHNSRLFYQTSAYVLEIQTPPLENLITKMISVASGSTKFYFHLKLQNFYQMFRALSFACGNSDEWTLFLCVVSKLSSDCQCLKIG